MATSAIVNSPYSGCTILLATKHAKSIAIAPPFLNWLGATVIEHVIDTDLFGTFTGEIRRSGNAIECARRKCEWSIKNLDIVPDYILASEGSFGLHPNVPFIPYDQEVLYFIDLRRNFHLHVSMITEDTNYRSESIGCRIELYNIVNQAKFPSHGLIISPNQNRTNFLAKGIRNQMHLENVFEDACALSEDGKAFVQTDMRAHMNPTRMNVIAQLATNLTTRLATLCPHCKTPGWGRVDSVKGLPCECCDQKTSMIRSEIWGCVSCDYKEEHPRFDGKTHATEAECGICNA